MFEIGYRVVCIETLGYGGLTVGKVYTVDSLWPPGIWVVDDKGGLVGMCSEHSKPYTETEAERRGAKFGVTGVVRQGNVVVSFISDKHHKNGLGETLLDVVNENCIIFFVHPGNIRLDHEPEYVAWSEAPEHLKYDASRVYCDGNPVKWIAKPEGAWSEVAYVDCDRVVRGSPDALTVKL